MTPTSLASGTTTIPSTELDSELSVALANIIIANSTDQLSVTSNGILRLVVQEQLVAALHDFVVEREQAVWQKAETIVENSLRDDDISAIPFAQEDRQYSE